jgi:hypothetical protein
MVESKAKVTTRTGSAEVTNLYDTATFYIGGITSLIQAGLWGLV